MRKLSSLPDLEPIRLFIGYDKREAVGYHVFCHSVISRTKQTVSITPVGEIAPLPVRDARAPALRPEAAR